MQILHDKQTNERYDGLGWTVVLTVTQWWTKESLTDDWRKIIIKAHNSVVVLMFLVCSACSLTRATCPRITSTRPRSTTTPRTPLTTRTGWPRSRTSSPATRGAAGAGAALHSYSRLHSQQIDHAQFSSHSACSRLTLMSPRIWSPW